MPKEQELNGNGVEKWGEWMKAERIARNLTQAELAAMIDYDDSEISRWETERKPPSKEAVTKWAEALEKGNSSFLKLALQKTGNYEPHIDSKLDPQSEYYRVLDEMIDTAGEPRLDFVDPMEHELAQFGRTWTDCLKLSLMLYETKDYARAAERATQLLGQNDVSRVIAPRAEAYLLDILGNAHYHLGNLSKVPDHLEKAIEIGVQLLKKDDQAGEENQAGQKAWKKWLASVYDHHSDVKRISGDYAYAHNDCDRALSLAKEIGDVPGQARAMRKYVLVDLVRGAKAREAIEQCDLSLATLDLSKEQDHLHQYERAKTFATRGWAKNIYGDLAGAQEDHETALKRWRIIEAKRPSEGVQYELMKCHRYLGDDFEQHGSMGQAEKYYQEAHEKALELGKLTPGIHDAEVGMIALGLAKVALEQEAWPQAEAHIKRALQAHEHSKDELRAALVLRTRGKFWIEKGGKGSQENAIREFAEAISKFSQVKAYGYVVGTMLDLAVHYLLVGDEENYSTWISEAEKHLGEKREPLDDQRVSAKYNIRWNIVSSLGFVRFEDDLEKAKGSLIQVGGILRNGPADIDGFGREGRELLEKLGKKLRLQSGLKTRTTAFAKAITEELRIPQSLLPAAGSILKD